MSVPGSRHRRSDPPWHLVPFTLPLLPWVQQFMGVPVWAPLRFILHGSQTHCVSSVQEGGAQVTRKDLEWRPDSIVYPGHSACPQLLISPRPHEPHPKSHIPLHSAAQATTFHPGYQQQHPTIGPLGHTCPQGPVSLPHSQLPVPLTPHLFPTLTGLSCPPAEMSLLQGPSQ